METYSVSRAGPFSGGVVHAVMDDNSNAPVRGDCRGQGFGRVGRGAARFLHEATVTVVAVSDQSGAFHRLTVCTWRAWKRTSIGGAEVGFAGADAFAEKDDPLDLPVPVRPQFGCAVGSRRNAGRGVVGRPGRRRAQAAIRAHWCTRPEDERLILRTAHGRSDGSGPPLGGDLSWGVVQAGPPRP